MALLHIEGFEDLGDASTSGVNVQALMLRRYISSWNTSGSSPRFADNFDSTGLCLNWNTSTFASAAEFYVEADTTDTSCIVGFRFKTPSSFNASNDTILEICSDHATDIQVVLQIKQGTDSSSGEFQINRNTIELGSTSTDVLGTNNWYYIELKLTIDNSGSYELRLDGVNVLSASGVDTKNITNTSVANMFVFSGYPAAGGDSGMIADASALDDIYICDSTGSVNNDFLGPCRVAAIFPDGDQAVDFSPSTGADNYALVGGTGELDDAEYVQSSTPTDSDVYTYASAPGNIDTIHGVQVNTYSFIDTPVSVTYDVLVNANSVATHGVGNLTGSKSRAVLLEENPATTTSWDTTAINSVQAGFERN